MKNVESEKKKIMEMKEKKTFSSQRKSHEKREGNCMHVRS